MIEECNADRLEQLKAINQGIYSEVNQVLNLFQTNTVPINSIKFVSYKLAQRFSTLLASSNVFIDAFKTNPDYEFQIGLMLRPALLDILSFIYITDEFLKIPDDDNKDWTLVNEKVEGLLADNLIKYKKEIDTFHSDGFIDINAASSTIALLKQLSNNIFQKDVFDKKEIFKMPGAKKMYDNLKSTIHKDFMLAYYLYSHYSKYEHFGLLTDLMNKARFNPHEDRVFRYFQAVFLINKTIIISLKYLHLETQNLNNFQRELDDLTTHYGTK